MFFSIDEKCAIFHEVINMCIKESIPCITMQSNQSDKPWITPLIKHLVNQRWIAYRCRDFIRYKFLKRKVCSEIKKAKQRWSLRAQRSSKDLWRVTNTVTGRKKNSLDPLLRTFSTSEEAADSINATLIFAFCRDEQPLLLPSNDPDDSPALQ